ncbi:hypothetical protein B296_00023633 [Ensete ventricosum]|uniref:Uncharacterized protein n=1 Tax=Ensete ventricosum TaxID=4639 RepID=A0A427AGB5_ENSVE|nr:hypothetical protein B296_00023633 [Ensete ventricosum]
MRRKKKPSFCGVGRPHSHHRTGGGDLFFCFNARRSAASSSSAAVMRTTSSKSLPSPGRSRDPSAAAAAAPSLSSSLSRRLRSSGSVKGGQSPMFPAVVGGRRKGVAFEAAEPSSPKVTCIGQVRVKSKKRKKASVMRSRSVRGSRREASFRRTEDLSGPRDRFPSSNQRWVHQLPMSICEALKAFGSEFNCFSPCGGRSLCSSSSASRSGEASEGEGGEKRSSSCGAAFARWLVAAPEGKRREDMGVAVENKRDREMGTVTKEWVTREDLGLVAEMEKREEVVMVVKKGKEEEEEEEEEEEARVSICIPPKNALLLMRCRSDPVKMAALTSRFWDSQAVQVRVDEGGEEEEDSRDEDTDQCRRSDEGAQGERDKEDTETEQVDQEEEVVEESLQAVVSTEEPTQACEKMEEAKEEEVQVNLDQEKQNKDEDLKEGAAAELAEVNANTRVDPEELEVAAAETDEKDIDKETHLEDREEKARRSSSCSSTADKEERSNRCISRVRDGGRKRSSASSRERERERDRRRHSFSTEREASRPSFSSEKEVRRASFSTEGKGRWSFSIEKDGLKLEKEANDEETETKEDCWVEEAGPNDTIEVQNMHSMDQEEIKEEDDGDTQQPGVEREAGEKRKEEKTSTELPDCLLLMMYEPKLSMEVSKETWVCSTDFLEWRLHHPNNQTRLPSKAATAATVITDTTSTGGAKVSDVTQGESSKKSADDKSSEKNETVASMREAPQHPPPPPPALPTMLDAEKKLRGKVSVLQTPAQALAYGPFVLTRCKSEPMRSSVRLAPDACFWKDRHQPIGATGIGF